MTENRDNLSIYCNEDNPPSCCAIERDFTIPPSLYSTNVEDIKKLHCTWDEKCNEDGSWWCMDEGGMAYSTYDVSDELHAYVQQFFEFDVIVNYQLIHGQIPVHTDYARSLCWNYIIDTGGQHPDTRFWNDEGTEIVERFDCKLHTWYQVNVTNKHDVSNIERFRIALTVFALDPEVTTK